MSSGPLASSFIVEEIPLCLSYCPYLREKTPLGLVFYYSGSPFPGLYLVTINEATSRQRQKGCMKLNYASSFNNEENSLFGKNPNSEVQPAPGPTIGWSRGGAATFGRAVGAPVP